MRAGIPGPRLPPPWRVETSVDGCSSDDYVTVAANGTQSWVDP